MSIMIICERNLTDFATSYEVWSRVSTTLKFQDLNDCGIAWNGIIQVWFLHSFKKYSIIFLLYL